MAGAIGTGICLCMERRTRSRQLKELGRAFSLTAGEVSYSKIAISRVLIEVGRRLQGELGVAFGRAGMRLEDGMGIEIGEIWKEELGEYLRCSKLRKEERALVLSFPEQVWFLDPNRQEAALSSFAQQFKERAIKVEEENSRQEKTTVVVCASVGILAVILLL